MIIAWSDIEDSVRLDEVIDALGVRVQEVKRGEHWASCPLPSHPGADINPSFSINEDTFVWHCFTCGDGGQLPLLVMRVQDTDWEGAVSWLLPFSDGPSNEDNVVMKRIRRKWDKALAPKEIKKRSSEDLPLYSDRVLEGLALVPLEILEQWYIDEATAGEFNLRYDPERDRKGKHAGAAMIIPHYFKGKMVGYQERWLGDRPGWLAKYTNTDGFPKKYTLFNYDRASRSETPIIVVESVMTVMRLAAIGYTALATFGASVTDEQIKLLRSFQQGLVLSNDNDGAGHRQQKALISALSSYVPLQVMAFPEGEKADLGDLEEVEINDLWASKKPAILVRSGT